MLKISSTMFVLCIMYLLAANAHAHCQIPCGIYDDPARIQMMREDLQTIIKSMNEINALIKKRDSQSENQRVRWIMNKEHHAEKIIRTIADYFLAQKIKPLAKGDKSFSRYLEQLGRHHAVIVAAMKCKQSTQLKETQLLGRAIEAIAGDWSKK